MNRSKLNKSGSHTQEKNPDPDQTKNSDQNSKENINSLDFSRILDPDD